ncbi:MAG: hypothetical protein IIV01_06190, partial [Bacteroidaceae bacterium]|nr:hypothetical protein [Bacteroidaceae bacterium]
MRIIAEHILFALLIMSSLSCTGKASTHSHTPTSSEIDSITYYYYYSNYPSYDCEDNIIEF